MKEIKGLEKLGRLLSSEKIQIFIDRAFVLHEQSNIEFEVFSVIDNTITLKIVQNETLDSNYFSMKGLLLLAKDCLNEIFDGSIIIRPYIYSGVKIDIVTADWINKEMFRLKVSLKQISNDTGVSKDLLSNYINKLEPFCQLSKAMFYYYFKSFN